MNMSCHVMLDVVFSPHGTTHDSLEVDENPHGDAERHQRHGEPDVVQGGRLFDARRAGRVQFQEHVAARVIVRVVVPRAVQMAPPCGVL